jgi:protein-tyrosine kinase
MNHVQEAMKRFKDRAAPQPQSGPTQKVQLLPVGRSERQSEAAPHRIAYTQSRCVDVPKELLERHRILHERSSPLFLESFKRLKTQVLHRLNENQWTVLGVFSPRSRQGTTLTALNLAVALGMDLTLTVLLVEGNLRKPNLHHLLGFPNSPGLVDFLQCHNSLQACLVHPNLGRLLVLPGGEPVMSSLELLTAPAMSDLVQEMKHRYAGRIIIFDLPPLLESADSLAFTPSLDASLLVVEEGGTSKADVRESLELLQGGVPVLGTVFNKVGRQTLTLTSANRIAAAGQGVELPVADSLWKRIFRRGE